MSFAKVGGIFPVKLLEVRSLKKPEILNVRDVYELEDELLNNNTPFLAKII